MDVLCCFCDDAQRMAVLFPSEAAFFIPQIFTDTHRGVFLFLTGFQTCC